MKSAKKMTKWIFIGLFALVGSKAKSQNVDSLVIKNYTPSIVVKVYEIVSKVQTPIPAKRQRQFARLFKENDSLITALIKNGSAVSYIDSVKASTESRFDSLLSTKENYKYYIGSKKVDNSYPIALTQISLAITYKDSIGLNDSAVNVLLTKLDTLKQMKASFNAQYPDKVFDSRPYESMIMTNILTEDQYSLLLNLKNKVRVKSFAESDWKELVQRGLDKNYNKDSTLSSLSDFYLARQNVYDRYAHDKIKQSANMTVIYNNRPDALKALIHARRNPGNNTIGQSYNW